MLYTAYKHYVILTNNIHKLSMYTDFDNLSQYFYKIFNVLITVKLISFMNNNNVIITNCVIFVLIFKLEKLYTELI